MKGWCLVLVTLAALAWFGHGRWWQLPDRHNPWAPLRLDEAPGWLTRYKISRVITAPAACIAWLGKTEWQFDTIPDRETASGCGLSGAVQVRQTSMRIEPAFAMTCRTAVALALWEKQVLQPQALAVLGSPVRRIRHLGSYACRNIDGRSARSQHATADALDVSGFVVADGRQIHIARDWGGKGSEADFLKAVHHGACGMFDGVLGPAYNDAHADHFHLDRGPYRLCR